jgi:hypothetical protein
VGESNDDPRIRRKEEPEPGAQGSALFIYPEKL